MKPIERLDYDLLARPYSYLHNVNILVIKLSIFNESYYLVVDFWQCRNAISGWRLTPIFVVCQLVDEAAPLGASLSGFAVPVGVAAGRELLLSVCRSLRSYWTTSREPYYILTPIWHDRRVRSTICDTVIGLSDRGSQVGGQ